MRFFSLRLYNKGMKKNLAVSLFLSLFLVGCGVPDSGSSSSLPSSSTSVPSLEPSSSSLTPSSSSSSASPSSSSSSSSSEGPVAVSSVILDQSSLTFDEGDEAVTLTATVLPDNAANKNVIWSSSDVNVATVDEGKVTPVNPGQATITVKTVDGNKTASCKVSVNFPNYVLHGKFNNESQWTDRPMVYNEFSTSEYMLLNAQLYKGDVFKIHMHGNVWYGASDLKSSVPSGLVTADSSDDNIKVLTTGFYDIYSSYNETDGGHIYLARSNDPISPGTVHVSDIILSRAGKYMQYRHEFILTANIYPSYASNQQVVWTSSDETIATVTSAGRVVAKEKTGSAIITAKTVDQGKTDTCLIYVSASPRPDYFLVGTIGGRSYSSDNYTFAALPLGSRQFFIPNVNLAKGDRLKVMLKNGSYLHSTSQIGNPIYEYAVSEDKSVNLYLDTTKNSDYLTAINRASRDIYVRYDSDTNNDGQCAWIFVEGPDITPAWLKSNSEMSGSTGCRFNIPRHATKITFVRADRNQNPDNYFSSLTGMTRLKEFDIVDGQYEYDARVDAK